MSPHKRFLIPTLILLLAGCSSDTDPYPSSEQDRGASGSSGGGKADNVETDAAHNEGADAGIEAGSEDANVASLDAGGAAGEDAATALEEEVEDPFKLARQVDLAYVLFDDDVAAPRRYPYPSSHNGMRLGGTEFWQKWAEGHNPTYSYSEGTEAGKRCMAASAMRFEAIMADAPSELIALKQESNWGGSFFNWNDDYSQAEWGSASGARLWAWRTSLVKWISQTDDIGGCFLPTRELVIRAAQNCLTRGTEIEGCSAR